MTAPELLKAEMPLVRRIWLNLSELGYTKKGKDYEHMFNVQILYYRKFGWTVKTNSNAF
jgi:hypothetical protein